MLTLPKTEPFKVEPLAPRADGQLRLGQLNAHNLFDTVDDPSRQDPVLEPKQYDHHLGKLAIAIRDAMGAPDIVTMQEVENAKVLQDLVSRPELAKLGYKVLIDEGTDPRGIDNAMIYRDTVRLLEGAKADPSRETEKGRSVKMFTRPPLVARFGVNGPTDAKQGADQLEFTVIGAHLTSKLGGEEAAEKRGRQAEYLRSLVDERRAANPAAHVVVMGDLNMEHAEPEFEPLRATRAAGSLASLAMMLPPEKRFSWRDGRRAVLFDHVLATKELAATAETPYFARISTQMEKGAASDPVRAEGVSDHDPMIATFDLAKL